MGTNTNRLIHKTLSLISTKKAYLKTHHNNKHSKTSTSSPHQFKSAFTIVELLVVIVIIGILATITMVSYNGVTKKSKEASLQSDLSNASKILEMDKIIDGNYPPNLEDANQGKGLKPSGNNTYNYTYDPTTKSYTLIATNGNLSYFITSSNTTPTLYVSSVTFVTSWGGANGDYGYSIAQTSDGGLAVTGRTNGFGAGNYDMFIAKYSSTGTLLWDKTWGGTSTDYGYSIIQTSDGGLAVTGQTASFGAGNEDMFIAKYSSGGNIVGCASPMCQELNATESSPTTTENSPNATDGNPSATVNDPTATERDPSATTNMIVELSN